MEWIYTVPGRAACGLALWLLVSIVCCLVLGQIARRLKGCGRGLGRPTRVAHPARAERGAEPSAHGLSKV